MEVEAVISWDKLFYLRRSPRHISSALKTEHITRSPVTLLVIGSFLTGHDAIANSILTSVDLTFGFLMFYVCSHSVLSTQLRTWQNKLYLPQISACTHNRYPVHFICFLEVTLRLTVSRSVLLGVLPLLEQVTRWHIYLSDNHFIYFSCRTPSLTRARASNLHVQY
jgi:hypothetical protein